MVLLKRKPTTIMIRVTVRFESSKSIGKILRFDESITFDALLVKIAHKLGLDVSNSQYQLLLGGGKHVIVEDTNEIEHGDDLILIEKKERAQADEYDDDDDDDESVQDFTEEALKQRAKQRQDNIVVLSSDDDENSNGDDEEEGSIAEGSDAWDEAGDEEEDDSDFELDTNEKTRKKKSIRQRNVKAKPPPESPLQVIMDEKDVPSAPGKRSKEEEETKTNSNNNDHGLEEVSMLVDGRKKADQAVKDRIIKLLNTGFHDHSNEHEAKNAMKLASRLMQKHNLSQALLLKEREEKNKREQNGLSTNDDDAILTGGMVRVRIVNRKTRKPALLARWINDLTHPVAKNFDVKCYYAARRGYTCTITFYGIYTNAQLAGYAFKVAVERIAQMAAEHQPEKTYYMSNNISTKSSRLSYAIGVVKGLSKEVDNNIEKAEERRLEKLAKARMAQSKGEAYEESGDEDDKDSLGAYNRDFEVDEDEDMDGPGFSFAKRDPQSNDVSVEVSDTHGDAADGPEACTSTPSQAVSGQDLKRRIEELEKEEQAAIVLVDHREKVAEQVLKENGIKLSKGRKRKAIDFDHRSYRKGIEDSKEIDINQRAIRDEVRVKKE